MANKNEHFIENIRLDGCKVSKRNFSGKVTDYNEHGYRQFLLVINPDLGEELRSKGWPVKQFKQKDPDEVPDCFIQVNVSYKTKEPMVWLIQEDKRTKTLLHENTIGSLDYAAIDRVDIYLHASYWERSGRSGYTAFCEKLRVYVKPDEFDDFDFDDFDEVTNEDDLPFTVG